MKKFILLIISILLVITLSSCDDYYGGYVLEASCSSDEITFITVRLHNKDDACCINLITYEIEYSECEEIIVYFPQEVIIDESGKTYPVRHFGGQGITDQPILQIYVGRDISTFEEIKDLKVIIHLGNVELHPIHDPRVEINGRYSLSDDNIIFVE
jgi:hypothetical protein